MFKEKIGKFEFVYEQHSDRIDVYREGDASPVRYITVADNITEKDFHYEIMGFIANTVSDY